MTEPVRAEIWLIDFEPARGSEANKTRPAVVISSATFDRIPLRLVVPLTEWRDRFVRQRNKVRIPRSDDNGLYLDSAADLMLLRSVSVSRFTERLGVLEPALVDDLLVVLGLVVDIDAALGVSPA